MRPRLSRAITMGLALASCSDRATSEDSEGGHAETTGTTGSPGATSTGPTTSTSRGEANADASDAGGEGVIFDMGPPPDIHVSPLDCEELPEELTSGCHVAWGTYPEIVMACQLATPGGRCSPADAPETIESLENCLHASIGSCGHVLATCGPVLGEQGQCCYWGSLDGEVCPGRPFVVDGCARLAGVVDREDWIAAWPPWERSALEDALAEAWLFDARHEHAAIASFSRFALQLLALAAPPRFIECAIRAAQDECEHARLFFGLARAHGGCARGPGPLDVDGALAGSEDPIHVVVSTVREGCIAETVSALQLMRARDGVDDDALRDALTRVIHQEIEHVELAWAFVAWAYARGDARLRAAVRESFANATQWLPRGPDVEPATADEHHWRARGRLTRAERRSTAMEALRGLVVPAARELLARAEPRRRVDPDHPPS